MKKLNYTYRYVVYTVITLVVVSCGAASMEEENSMNKKEISDVEEEAAMAKDEASAGASEESAKKTMIDTKIWNNKAKQQLESIQDLSMVLKDETLDASFRFEIEKELSSLYNILDSNMFMLTGELNFKNFKDLQVESGDTMSLQFKNKKDILLAKFIVIQEPKTFGESTEVVEQLKLISIRKVD